MSAAAKLKTGLIAGLPPRSKSTNNKPNRPQARTLITVESPIPQPNKSRSDSSLTNGLQQLSLRERRRANGSAKSNISTASTNAFTKSAGVKRNISSAGSRIQSLDDVVRLISTERVKNIVVMAGAGISTPSGIPDFRSPGTGLYDNLKQYNIPYPEAIFDIDYFHYKPRPFFELAKELYPSGKYRPNIIHYFVRMLHDRGLLLRMYTQNIDGLERLCGIPPAKMVEAHGTFATATCTACNKQYPGDEIKGDIFQGKIPYCRKRTSCSGVIKPDIVFFGEDLPKRFYYYLRDFPQADLLLVLGTSLEVEPFAGIVDSTRYHVPRVLLNMKAVGPFRRRKRFNDLVHEGDLVNSINELIRLLSWRQTLNTLTEQTNSQLDTMYAAQKHQISASSDNNTTDTSSTDCKPTSAQNNNNKPGLSNKSGLTNSKPGVAPPRPTRQYHTYSASSRQRSGPARQSKSSFALPSIGGRESSNKIYTYRNMWNHRQQSSDSSSSEDDDEESDEDDSSDSDD